MSNLVRARGWGLKSPPVGATVDAGHPLARGLVAAFPFNEQGTAPRDVVTGVAIAPTGACFHRASAAGSGHLTGTSTSNYASLVGVPGLWKPTKNVTIFWRGLYTGTQTNMAASGPGMFSVNYDNSGTTPFVAYGLAGYTASHLYVFWNNGTFRTLDSGVTIPSGIPFSFAATINGDAPSLTAYVNGRPTAVAPTNIGTISYSANTTLRMGGNGSTPTASLETISTAGYIWNRALTPTEIQWLHAEPYAMFVPPGPKILYFALSPPGGIAVAGTQANETDTGNAGVTTIVVIGSQAQESDTANAGVARITAVGSQANESDLGNAGVASVTIVGTQAQESDTANAGVARVTAVGSQAQESDLGNAGAAISGAGTVAGSQAQESDTANAGVARITVVGSQAQESDLGNAGSAVNGFFVVGTQAQEADTGNAGTAVQVWIGSQATETDTALAGVARVTIVGSRATESDVGNAGIVLRPIVGTQATEIDLGNAGTTTGGTVTIHPETATVTVNPQRRTATVVVTR